MLKKSFEFILNKISNIVIFNLNFVLLLEKFDSVPKKQCHKRDALIACDFGCVKMIFTLLTKIVILHV